MKILFISAEVAPFAKTGGLGDVAGSLPKALAALGHDVRVVMPAYAPIEQGYAGVTPTDLSLAVPVRDEKLTAGVFEGTLPDSTVPIYFIAEQFLFNRPNVYGDDDDVYRFAFFSRAVFELIRALDWRPDILHAHDWHTAPAVTWLATAGQADLRFAGMASVFTIHNLMHQGRAAWDVFDYLRLWTHALVEEPYGSVNFMARGIYHATRVNTVSPTYAHEITTSAGGAGLDGLLRSRGAALSGILNGIDTDRWDPARDPRLPDHFSADTLENRRHIRRRLQAEVGLPQRDDVPLVGFVSRLDGQKGIGIMGDVNYRLMRGDAGDAQLVVLGTGEPEYELMFAAQSSHFPQKMRAVLQFRADLAPLIYGGADIFVMPSLFEPCGLSQMIAMRYGCLPVVRATGGLVDTVWDGVTGFRFDAYSAGAFWHALARAVNIFNADKPRWQEMQRTAMGQDFSWDRSARQYVALYEDALGMG